jgi:hypothetical protein
VRDLPLAAMRELADVDGLRAHALGSSSFLVRLSHLAHALDPAKTTERYAAALGELAKRDTELRFGSWHGDWQPFNMTRLRHDRFGVWDWERFTGDAPLGFDALHYALQVVLHGEGIDTAATRSYLDVAAGVATRAGVQPKDAPVVVAAYAAEMTGRYLSLLQGPDGQVLARRAHWTLGLLESAMARL